MHSSGGTKKEKTNWGLLMRPDYTHTHTHTHTVSDFIARHGHHSQQMEDFLREAKEMSKVDHHRVVKLLAVCTL